MQTETLENQGALVAPINAVAELIDREIHAKTLEQIAQEFQLIYNKSKRKPKNK